MPRLRVAGVVLLGGLLLLSVSIALAATGELTQKAGIAGCVSDDGTSDGTVVTAGECADGNQIEPRAVVVSPDGLNVYAASATKNAIDIFDRDPATGAITQKPGAAGCISEGGGGGCGPGVAISNTIDITVSPDGENVYVVALSSDALTIFDRDLSTGALTQKTGNAGEDGCISDGGFGVCVDGRVLDAPSGVVVSPDGENVYVASGGLSDAIAVFDRNTSTGVLDQPAGTAGCISESGADGCGNGRGLGGVGQGGASSLAITTNGLNVYATSANDDINEPDSLAVLIRNPGTGTLSQTGTTADCFSDTGSGGDCTDVTGLDGAEFLAISPDDANVYVSGAVGVTDAAITIFDRANDGTLTQKALPAGCITDDGSLGCTDGLEVDRPRGVTVSPDGETVYISGFDSGSIAIFDRANDGVLTQKAIPNGCVTDDGSGGDCLDGKALGGGLQVALSPDGTSLYVPAVFVDAVAVFDRDDGVAPDTSISSGPTGQTTNRSPSFAFTADEPDATLECRLDSEAFAACTSPKAYSTLALGAHTFQVRGTDRFGNVEASPASRAFTIVAPVTPDTTVNGSASARSPQRRQGNRIRVRVK